MKNVELQEVDVSIVIVNWNTCEITCDCLRSVFEQTRDVSFEVILFDNASSDDSVGVIKKEFPHVILIENSENQGFATANNQGMAIAKGKYVLLLNSDTIVLDHAIEKTIHFADQHPEAGIVGCRVLNHDMSLQPSCFMYPSVLNMFLATTYLYKIFPKSSFFGRERMTWWDFDDVREVDVLRGCFMLVSAKAMHEVGVFDESYFMYCEETDWCYRMKKSGLRIIFTPEAEIVHLGGQSSKKIATDMALQLRGSILYYIKKHQMLWEYFLACFFVWLFCVVRIPFWFARFLFGRKDRGYNWGRMKIYLIGAWRLLVGGPQSLTRNHSISKK